MDFVLYISQLLIYLTELTKCVFYKQTMYIQYFRREYSKVNGRVRNNWAFSFRIQVDKYVTFTCTLKPKQADSKPSLA